MDENELEYIHSRDKVRSIEDFGNCFGWQYNSACLNNQSVENKATYICSKNQT